ncbi:MAG TPA: fatty acid desaturase, partial [Longimicrobiales bacterium]|nr:fatty acid desaturase [Longimicrobiales bacterium]
MAVTRIRFPKKDSALFIPEVRAEVAAYFDRTGKSTKADFGMKLKTVLLLGTTFGAYGLIMTGWFTPLAMLGLAILMGIGMAGIGFAVAHDALHGAYSANPRVNRALGFSFDLLGANGYMWKITHNVIHHTYTNIPHVDEDLTVSPLLRLSPEEKRDWFHRW